MNRVTPVADPLSLCSVFVGMWVVILGCWGGIYWLTGGASLTYLELPVILGIWAICALGTALFGIIVEREWHLYSRTAVEAVGTVVGKAKSDYGDYTLYHVTVRFGVGSNEMSLKATVQQELYESASKGASLIIRYAPSIPQMALLEGEY